jgi:HK97 family phage major capsid protein
MEIKDMQMSDIEVRSAELETALTAENADIESITAEVTALEERKAQIVAEAEERKAQLAAVEKAAVEVHEVEERKETMNMEIRNTNEYIEAYAKYIKTGDEKECRELLTDQATGGVLPTPEFVYGIVAKRLEASKILSRVRRMNARGVVKVGFEYAAPAAVAHEEGGDPIDEEALALGIVTMVPVTWKKWVSISDEALDTQSGADFLAYIYDEVARGIIKARENAVVAAILAAPQTADGTHPSVAKTGSAAGAIADFVNARALLSSAAEDLVIICTPAQYAMYKGLQMAATYGADPFDGIEVLFNDQATAPIIGDLSGVLENLPKGNDVEFKYDDKTRMKQDLVDILGRQPSAIAVVGDKYFAKVAA